MNWLNKLERKFGRYAVPNLIVYLIGAYSVGFVLNMVAPNILGFLNFQPYYILHGQIWRLITWILMPTDSNIIFLLIMNDVLLSAWNCVGARVGNFPF